MLKKSLLAVCFFILLTVTAEAVTIKIDSLRYLVARLDVQCIKSKDSYHRTYDYTVVSDEFYDILFQPVEYDLKFFQNLPSRVRVNKVSELQYTDAVYFVTAFTDDQYDRKVLTLPQEKLLLSFHSEAHGYETNYSALAFWEIQDDELILLNVYDKVFAQSFGGYSLLDGMMYEGDILIALRSRGADAFEGWGSFELWKFDLSQLDNMEKVYQVDYHSDSLKEHEVIENFRINKNLTQPSISYDHVKYSAEKPVERKSREEINRTTDTILLKDILK